MKTHYPFVAALLLSCQQPQQSPPPPLPETGKLCVTIDPPDALLKVQGARLKNNGCTNTFGGEVAIEATAPGYQPYRELLPVGGHASAHHVQMKKELPKSTSQPESSSAPTSQPSSQPSSMKR